MVAGFKAALAASLSYTNYCSVNIQMKTRQFLTELWGGTYFGKSMTVCNILNTSMDCGEVNCDAGGDWQIFFFLFPETFTCRIRCDCLSSWVSFNWLRQKAVWKEQEIQHQCQLLSRIKLHPVTYLLVVNGFPLLPAEIVCIDDHRLHEVL